MFKTHCIANKMARSFKSETLDQAYDMYMAKQIMIVVQANPKTHPGGDQGALFNSLYHSEGTPFPVNKPPMPRAAKLRTKKIIILYIILFF